MTHALPLQSPTHILVSLPDDLAEHLNERQQFDQLLYLIFERHEWLRNAVLGANQRSRTIGREELVELRNQIADSLFERMKSDREVLKGDIPLRGIHCSLPCHSRWAELFNGEDVAVPGAVVLLDLIDLLSNMLTIHQEFKIELSGGM